ncbi:MAG TPA: sigma-70 family RNA polymerase sigma factor [Myxococcota bacterium]
MNNPVDDGLRAAAQQFEATRAHLLAVAYRMLGSHAAAEDAVQEAWLRLTRANVATVDNLGGWLTTVVARVALDMLRSRKARREDAADDDRLARVAAPVDIERDALLADALGPALLVLLETLQPAERVAFVLHDMFDLSFDEIGGILGRSSAACRQLASRARRRVRDPQGAAADETRARELVDAFLAASRDGDIPSLLKVLAPDALMHADDAAVAFAAKNGWGGAPLPAVARGADDVAHALVGRARGVVRASIDGTAGAAWFVAGVVRSAFCFRVEDRIVAIDLVVDEAHLRELTVEIL